MDPSWRLAPSVSTTVWASCPRRSASTPVGSETQPCTARLELPLDPPPWHNGRDDGFSVVATDPDAQRTPVMGRASQVSYDHEMPSTKEKRNAMRIASLWR